MVVMKRRGGLSRVPAPFVVDCGTALPRIAVLIVATGSSLGCLLVSIDID